MVSSTAMPDHLPSDLHARFIALFVRHQAAVRSYIRPLLSGHDDVDEVMQNASLVAWKKFADLTDESGFAKWLGQIARYEALTFRRSHARDRLVLSDAVIEALDGDLEETDPRDERAGLDQCLGHLPPPRRDLVLKAYAPGVSLVDLAKEHGRTPDSLYQILCRIRQVLASCLRSAQAGRSDGR